jgi:Peptidase family M23
MTEFTAQNPQDKKPEKQFSSITPGISVSNFLNYKPIDSKDQGYHANRGGLPHYSIDYGSNAGITKGSTILAIQGGEATPHMKWYTNSKTRTTDAGVRIRSKDPQTGKDVYTTYGHLSQASVAAMFPGGRSRTLQAGEKIGEVGTTGKAANNEYHVHVDVIDANPVDRLGRGRKSGAHTGKYSHNPLDYFKGVAKAAGDSASTNNSNTQVDNNTTDFKRSDPATSTPNNSQTIQQPNSNSTDNQEVAFSNQNPVKTNQTANPNQTPPTGNETETIKNNPVRDSLSTQIPSTSQNPVIPSTTALTGTVTRNTALTGTIPAQSTQILSTSQNPITPSTTALTGTVARNTALTGTIPTQSTQILSTGTTTALTGTTNGSSPTALTGGESTTALTGGTSTTALTGGRTQEPNSPQMALS